MNWFSVVTSIASITPLFVLFVALQIADVITTITIIKRQNGRELNKVLTLFIDKIGTIPTLIIWKLSVLGLFGYAAFYHGHERNVYIMLAAFDVIYAVTVAWNLYQIHKTANAKDDL